MRLISFQKRFHRVSLKERLGKSNFITLDSLKPITKKESKETKMFKQQIPTQIISPKMSSSTLKQPNPVHSNPSPSSLPIQYKRAVEESPKTLPKITKKVAKVPKKISIQNGTSVRNLAQKLSIMPFELIKKIHQEFGINQQEDDIVNQELCNLLIQEYNATPVVVEDFDVYKRKDPLDWSAYKKRDPIVTIMGHVDHGKTTLLDSLRKTSVAANEAGGITQHIGAFSVKLGGRGITFLDTPGHAAFSEMRKRGAQVTDVVVLVVACDDGVMPQTIEAIKHTLKSKVPMIVAVNKCDKPGVDQEKILVDLLQHSVVVESMGGEVPAVFISGKTGKGLKDLEETILAIADINDFRGDSEGLVEGNIIEAKIAAGLGNAATVIVKRGTLKPGATIVAGDTWCKVKRLVNDQGKTVKSAGPSIPVEVYGWKELPQSGDEVLETESELIAKKVAKDRKRRLILEESFKDIELINQKKQMLKIALENIENEIEQEITPDIIKYNAILKGDVHGSLEAIEGVLSGIPNHKVQYHTVSTSVGQVTESDVELAHSAKADIISFNLPVTRNVTVLAKQRGVQIHSHTVIYTLIDQVYESMSSLLEPETITTVTGEAVVQQIFEITVKKAKENIAGCKVQTGKIMRNLKARVMRGGNQVFEGKIRTFKHHKKDILEALKGLECGIAFEDFGGFEEGDVIQSLTTTTKKQTIQ